jgi:type VI secretion system protein ImpJ
MVDQLARIDWRLGQTLLPEHFIAQEDAFTADVAARFGLIGVPYYGIGRLRWNDALLADGILSLISGTIVLPTGKILDIPGNTQALSFNLNTTGTTRVVVYLHLTNERGTVEGDGANAATAGDDGEPVERVIHQIAFSSDQAQKNAVYTMRFAEFEKNIENVWSLVEDYVPPLVCVGTSPFLARVVDRLGRSLQAFHEKLREDIAASYLGGEGLFSAKICLKGVWSIERVLANLRGQVKLHPHAFYEALKTFYAEVCIYQDVTPENIASPYTHDDLAGCLRKVTKPLFEQLQVTRGKTPYLAFERKDGMFLLASIPQEVRVAKDVYLLLQKPRVSEVVSIEGIKLASRTRLPVVHQLSLVGIPIKRIERPPFQHQFGAEVEFYQLVAGDEWDQALRESNLAFFDMPALAKAKAYVYWRNA